MAGAEEMKEAEVTQDLKLLADFVADVAIIGMKGLELIFEGVNVGEECGDE